MCCRILFLVPASVTISSLSATDTTIEVNVSHPVSADGLLFEYYVQYSTTQRFTFPKSHSFNAAISHLLILNHLLPEAEYYIQVLSSKYLLNRLSLFFIHFLVKNNVACNAFFYHSLFFFNCYSVMKNAVLYDTVSIPMLYYTIL